MTAVFQKSCLKNCVFIYYIFIFIYYLFKRYLSWNASQREVYSKDVGGVVWKPTIIFNQTLQNLENNILLGLFSA